MINWFIELLMICQYRLDKTNHLLGKWREAIHSTRATAMRVRVDLIMKRLASIDAERSLLMDRLVKLTDNNGPQKVVYLDHLRYLAAQRINVVAQIAKVTQATSTIKANHDWREFYRAKRAAEKVA